MGEIVNKIVGTYTYVMDELSDPRTRHLPLMSNPLPLLILVAVYLKFCTSIGPRFMKNRPAFELKTVIMIYNIFQVLLSAFLLKKGLYYMLSEDYSFVCDPITHTNDPRVYLTARNSWWYFFAKNTELLETVFFVLRKKNNQISTLHLYHHTMVLLSAWLACKFFPVGPLILVGTLNSFVHVLMYTYYFLAGLGPQYQKYLWWKKHLTLIQLIQFSIIIAHNVNALFHDCNYPKLVHVFLISNALLLTYMFGNFYHNSYVKVKSKKTEVNGKIGIKEVPKNRRKNTTVGQ
ncbi:unnamed protein product [Arctia plantaginis]|uniref:Elongation of very long chain fatty acids protein n=1 Tax=Arctia plantaginis TaxID=874455 RepID=A0A8S0Z5A5_ARCPL|nr:unnamed protein product [Arctia plantaginis]